MSAKKNTPMRRSCLVALTANPIHRAIENAAKLPEKRADGVMSRLSLSVVELHTDKGVRGQVMAWKALGDSANIAEQLSLLRICSDTESRVVFAAWQEALASVWSRIHAKTFTGLEPGEIEALHAGLERYEIQLRTCSRREYERAVSRVVELVRQAMTGNAGEGVIPIGYLGDVVRDAETVLRKKAG